LVRRVPLNLRSILNRKSAQSKTRFEKNLLGEQGGFRARAAALEAPRGIRVNVVSPPWVTETLKAMNMDPSRGKPAVGVAQAYVKSIEGQQSGDVIEV
jgi:hypothetical protein